MGRPSVPELSRAIVTSAKYKKDYATADRLFLDMLASVQNWVDPSPVIVNSFQISIATLVRHAPTPERAIDYTCFLLRDMAAPIRTEALENTVLINCIFVHSRSSLATHLARGLELIRVGLEREMALPERIPAFSSVRESQDKIFDSVSLPILRHYGLQIAEDRRHLQAYTSIHRRVSHRP